MQIETSACQGGVHQFMDFHFRKPKPRSDGGTPTILLRFAQKLVSVSLFSEAIHFFSRERSMNLLVVPLYMTTGVLITEQQKEARGPSIQDIDCYLIHLFQDASHSALDYVSQDLGPPSFSFPT